MLFGSINIAGAGVREVPAFNYMHRASFIRSRVHAFIRHVRPFVLTTFHCVLHCVLCRFMYTQVQVWDTAGQERYNAVTSSHYHRADGALLVYDCMDRSSFNNASKWLRRLRDKCTDNAVVLCLGNKMDLMAQTTGGGRLKDMQSSVTVNHHEGVRFAQREKLFSRRRRRNQQALGSGGDRGGGGGGGGAGGMLSGMSGLMGGPSASSSLLGGGFDDDDNDPAFQTAMHMSTSAKTGENVDKAFKVSNIFVCVCMWLCVRVDVR